MHILLLILKIIGILILVVLGILLTLSLLVLFVPIRYRIDGEKEEQSSLNGKIRFSWLLHILSIHISVGEEISVCIKIFGYTISLNEKKEGNPKKEVNRDIREKKKEREPKKKVNPQLEKKEKFVEKTEQPIQTTEVSRKETLEKKENLTNKNIEISNVQPKKKKNIFYRIWKRIVCFLETLKRKYQQLISTLYNLKSQWRRFIENKEILVLAWQNQENRKGIAFLWESIKKLLQHIAPGKWTGYVHFGMKNPASTGKILGLLSIFGGIIGVLPEIRPDFEQEVFEGKGMLKGRIYTIYVIRLFIQIWRKKEVHRLIDNLKKVREELSWQKTT